MSTEAATATDRELLDRLLARHLAVIEICPEGHIHPRGCSCGQDPLDYVQHLSRVITGHGFLTWGDEGPVLAEIAVERAQQDARWGQQNHPDGTGYAYMRDRAEIARRECNTAFANGSGTWRHILREEYREALAATTVEELRAELVQVAAVATAWIQAIDRRTPKEEP